MMARRNEQEYENKRQQIIDGALQVFADLGIEKATNRDIAAAAGIGSPGLIYHYFKDKNDLFRAVLEHRVPAIQLLTRPDDLMALPPQKALTEFARAFLGVMERPQALAFQKLMFGEATRSPEVARMLSEVGPNRAIQFFSVYLSRQMDAGVLRRTEPGAAARCFLGPLIFYLIGREVFRQPDALQIDTETFIKTTVDIFLRGMQASDHKERG